MGGGRIYGWRFAALSPVRVLWGNLINFQATAKALTQFAEARVRGTTLGWQKTDHSYPVHSISTSAPRGSARADAVGGNARATPRCARCPRIAPGRASGGLRKLSEEEVYRALGTQAGIPLGAPPHHHVSRKAARTLPAEMAKRGVSCPIAW